MVATVPSSRAGEDELRSVGPWAPERTVEYAVLVLAMAFVAWRLRVDLVLADTVPAGGDLSAHIWGPDYLQEHLLPQVSGWSWDQFAGFPAYEFYPVLPGLLVVVADLLLPTAVALKVVVGGALLLVVFASWAFARWWRVPFPAAPLFAVAALVLTFDTSPVVGGTLESTISGEFSHDLALGFGVLALGLLGPVLREGRHLVPAALLFAAAALAHPLGLVFVGLGTVAILAVHVDSGWRTLSGRVAAVAGVGSALAGIWWFPFVLRHGWMTSPGFPRQVELEHLFPYTWAEPLLLALTAAGVVLGWRSGRRIVGALALVALLCGLLYLALPEGQLQHTRVLPFWAWSRLALAAVGVAELSRSAQARSTVRVGGRPFHLGLLAPVVCLVVTVVTVMSTLRLSPLSDDAELDNNVRVAFAGYERNPQYPDYDALMDAMAGLGQERGCGRFMWSVDVFTTDFGTVANDLAPYWTDGCIASVSGLWYDSSATTPFIAMTEALTGIAPLGFAPDLPYRGFDLAAGVRHLRYLGVRYYAARTPEVIAAATTQTADLVPVASAGPWEVFELRDHAVVSALPAEPVVHGLDASWESSWPVYTEHTPRWDQVVLTQTGPPSWRRLAGPVLPADRALPPVAISNVALRDGGLSFTVDRPGVPVLVKASYFPTWQVHGADGPYRTAGNLMVVVPNATEVTMDHALGLADWLARLSLLVGLVGLGALAVVSRRARARQLLSRIAR